MIIVASAVENGPTTFTQFKLKDFSCCQLIPEQTRIYYIPNNDGEDLGILKKSIKKNAKKTFQLSQFFNANYFSVGTESLCEVAGKKELPQITAYTKVNFENSSHYIFLRNTENLEAHLPLVKKINIITGPCLFSNKTARFVFEDNDISIDPVGFNSLKKELKKPIIDIAIEDNLSLYEYEAISRLSVVIRDLIKTIPDKISIEIVIDIPKEQYYFYLISAYIDKFISKETLLKWFQQVNARHDKLSELLKEKIAQTPQLEFRKSQALFSLQEYIVNTIKADKIPDLEDMLCLLKNSNDPIWQLVLEVENPSSFQEIGMLSYAVTVLRNGFSRKNETLQMGISIENPMETKIFNKVTALISQIEKNHPEILFTSLGIYSFQHILVNNGNGNFYYNDPGRYAMDKNGNSYDLFNFVDQLYFSEQKNNSGDN